MQFASFKWQSRWNHSRGVSSGLTQDGSRIMLTTAMGCVFFDFDSPHNDVESFCHSMEQALALLRKTKKEYDETIALLSSREET